MKIFSRQNLGVAIVAAAVCSGCATTEPTEAPINTQVAVKPAQKPTSKPTQTETEKRNAEKKRAKSEAEAKAKAADAANIVFDLPQLIHKDIDKVESLLGAPTDAVDMQQVGMSALKSWSNKGYTIFVDYQTNGTVTGIVFTANGSSSKSKSKMFKAGNIQENASDYFVKITDDTSGNVSSITVRP